MALKTWLISGAVLAAMLPFQNCSPGFEQAELPLSLTRGLSQTDAFGKSALRRLTRTELKNTLQDVFATDPGTLVDSLPEDYTGSTHFDNEPSTQSITQFIVQNYHDFAEAYSRMVTSDPQVSQRLAGCTPASHADRVCFETFAKRIGRRIMRRPISDYELQRYVDLLLPFAQNDQNFNSALALLVQVWVQHPGMLYRIEAGTGIQPQAGIMQLDQFEIASRISYLLWGSAPDDQLLDAAEAGKLLDPDFREAQASRMLDDARARRQMHNFHAQWLGYGGRFLKFGLEDDMRAESAALIDRVVFEKNRPWLDIFDWNETFVTPALAQHYGMAPMANPAWVAYTGERGGGIISHATFASLGEKFGDTSPTLRGYEIYKRLFCGKLGNVPPGIDVDNPPGVPGDCKEQRYSMRQQTGCASCHNITDNIGFGLENYGSFGEWRAVEPGLPNCTISGEGEASGKRFNTPREFAQIVVNSPEVSACATKQLFRFMTGRIDNQDDRLTLEAMKVQYLSDPSLKSVLISLIRSPGIMHN